MTDLLSMPIWFFLLSWLIRQVESGISPGGDNDLDEKGDGNQTEPEETDRWR